MYLSRVTLAPGRPEALLSVLPRAMKRDALDFGHRMIWTLFAEPAARRRGLFLYHVERRRPFTALVRSARPPEDGLGCWQIETVPFDPPLGEGQRLSFALDAVAVKNRPVVEGKRGRREDIVMSAWHELPEQRRASLRFHDIAEPVAFEWLARQGMKHGFASREDEVIFRGYERHRLPGRGRAPAITFGSLRFEGHLVVTDSDAFRRMLADGLGAEKAFGFGMMLIGPPRRPLMPTPAGG